MSRVVGQAHVLSAVGRGSGWALDLGGGRGELGVPVRERGYRYANIDLSPSGRGAVAGDAERLAFGARTFELVVSSDSLEHFPRPMPRCVRFGACFATTGRS